MAKKSATSTYFNIVLILSAFFLFISVAEGSGRFFGNEGIFAPPQATPPPQPTPKCDKVFGVRSGDTCFGVAQLFNLTTEFFNVINPNLQCNHLFVGQWLCIAGTIN